MGILFSFSENVEKYHVCEQYSASVFSPQSDDQRFLHNTSLRFSFFAAPPFPTNLIDIIKHSEPSKFDFGSKKSVLKVESQSQKYVPFFAAWSRLKIPFKKA